MAKDLGPGVRFPPPIGMLLIIGLAEVINRWVMTVAFDFYNIPMAIITYLVATVIVAVAAISFKRHDTNIIPYTPDSALITNGIFAFSRNPIYLAFFLYQIMFGFIFHNAWQLILLPVSYGFLRFYVIHKEEAYLTELFGTAYTDYQKQVRRWL